MKVAKQIFVSLLIIGVWSCSNDGPETDKPLYLIKANKVLSYTQSQAAAVVAFAALSYPGFLPFAEKVKYGVSVYYVEYKTDYTQGGTITASGLVIVPEAGNTPTMLMSFQNGTIVEHADAPSQRPGALDFMVLHAAAGLGFTICIADNIGFGASSDKPHPYLNKGLFQKSVVNLVRAVKELEKTGTTSLNLNGDLYFTGYSLGGWASLVAHKFVEENGIKGFNLVGSSCGAGAYNLLEMRDFLFAQSNYIQPYYLPFLLWGYRSTGDIENDMALFFREPYASRIPTLYNGLLSGNEINAQLTSNIAELMVSGLIEDPTLPQFTRLNQALQNNSQSAWVNQKPIHFYHGTNDLHVPYSITENLVTQFRNLGQTGNHVMFTTIPGADHRSGSIPMFLDVLNFLIAWAP